MRTITLYQRFLAVALFLMVVNVSFSQTYGGVAYTVDDANKTVTITGLASDFTGGAIDLSEFSYEDYSIKIKDSAFKGKTNITSVSFPKQLINIDSEAFSNCTGLIHVDFPDDASPIRIGYRSFYSCSNLESIETPEILSIGNDAFYASGLKRATFGKEGQAAASNIGHNMIGQYGSREMEEVVWHLPNTVGTFYNNAWTYTFPRKVKKFYYSNPSFVFHREDNDNPTDTEIDNFYFTHTYSENLVTLSLPYKIIKVVSSEAAVFCFDRYNNAEGTVELSKIGSTAGIEAGDGIILKTEPGKSVVLQLSRESKTVTTSNNYQLWFQGQYVPIISNKSRTTDGLAGTIKETAVNAQNGTYSNFLWDTDHFVAATGDKLEANRAYLQLTGAEGVQTLAITEGPTLFDGGNTLTVSAESGVLYIGDELKLTSNKTVTWASSDTDIVTVDNSGKVIGIATGTATITATMSGSSTPATYQVEVREKNILGDVNNDGKINSADITAIRNLVLFGNINGK